MKKKINLHLPLFLALSIILISPVSALVELGSDGLLERLEPLMEIINLIIAVTVLTMAILILPKLGGLIKHTWIHLTLAVGAFALLEVVGALKLLNIFVFHGLGDLIELIFIIFLLIFVYNLNKTFNRISGGIKSSP